MSTRHSDVCECTDSDCCTRDMAVPHTPLRTHTHGAGWREEKRLKRCWLSLWLYTVLILVESKPSSYTFSQTKIHRASLAQLRPQSKRDFLNSISRSVLQMTMPKRGAQQLSLRLRHGRQIALHKWSARGCALLGYVRRRTCPSVLPRIPTLYTTKY